ncbi:MAG TPA: tetratricopeptide repeat protein [Gemmatimonadales bacterium]|nr:tetratricopeptide repeat protein [Gemmatimonadales bacterium]
MRGKLTRSGRWRRLAPLLLLALLPAPLAAQSGCPRAAGSDAEAGWKLYRQDSVAAAAVRFQTALSRCPASQDARNGLGYVLLRQNRLEAAESLFRVVVYTDSADADGWSGLALASLRRNDQKAAVAAGRRAIRLDPKNGEIRSMLDRVSPDWQRPPLGPKVRPAKLRVDARTRGESFEIPTATGWKPFYIHGVNMGVAMPGKYPSEFPPDSQTYAGWLDTLARMNANTLRVYTVLPPSFYRALRGWNVTHPDQLFWLISGVWTELPPEDDFDNAQWKEQFRAEMRRVVNLLHGHTELPPRPGHASGTYDADVSRWVLGYILGREWEPFAVKAFDAVHQRHRPFKGRFLTAASAPAMEAWMAEQCDYMLAYEVDSWNAIKPIAYTNWPTLDPLTHQSEATSDQEAAWRAKAGRSIPRSSHEYENDAIGIDAMLIKPTTANPAGWFASFHAYPYYPDFMINELTYDTATSSEGRSNYMGYLRELKRHHAGIPLIIAEYGVPSSRGDAHLQPQGWDHGGHDEIAQAAINARLTREIREAGLAGAIIFAWLDEWFKKNWIVIDYEIPLENTRQWHNMMDAEQNYGILGLYAGDEATTPSLGGDPARWRALDELSSAGDAAGARPGKLRVGSDESYLYLALEFPGLAGRDFPWDSLSIRLALDTYRAELGQHRLQGGPASEIGFEFLAEFTSAGDGSLRITPDYNPYVGRTGVVDGDDYGRFARRPITITSRDDGKFDSLFVITNRARFGRDGRFFPSKGYDRGRLKAGTDAASTLSDWYYDRAAGLMEVRLPWGLINVSDPSTRTLLYEDSVKDGIGTARSDGFRIGAVILGKDSGHPVAALPALVDGRWRAGDFKTWTWQGWETPKWHQRLKPLYDSLKAVWATQ